MSAEESNSTTNSNNNNVSYASGNKPSSPNDHQQKHSGTFTNDNTDSVDSASGLRHRIFAGNLDFGTTKEQLYEAFSKCGKIVDEIRLHPGYAFIQFESEQACLKAIATLSGTQLCSKRIDVQMAKGPNNSLKKDPSKRKLDSRDRPGSNSSSRMSNNGDSMKSDRFNRDNNNKNKKIKRTPQSNPPLPSIPTSTIANTPSPYSSSASGVTSVPIYIPDQTLEPFANFVMQTLKSGGLIYHNVHIRNTNQGELFFTSPQFLQLVANERFVIYILARHELARNVVSFKALMPDGTSPGFADTMVTDICSFILNSPPPVQVPNVYQQYAMQYSAGIPPSNPVLSVPGLSFGYNNTPQQQSPQTYNNNNSRPLSSGSNYGNTRDNRTSSSSYNRNNNRRDDGRNNRNDNRPNNNYRDDDRRGNNNNNRPNNNYRGGNNNYQKESGSNTTDNNEVQGLIIKLLDTINKKPGSTNNSILLSESASSTTGHDDYHSPSDQYH